MKTTLEIWRPAKGYDYEVSNFGRVRNAKSKRLLKPFSSRGYLQVLFSKDGVRKTYYVHRLVAEAFIPNPDNLPCVNHTTEDRTRNEAWLLEWCSYSYNNSFGTCMKRRAKALLNCPSTSKRVAQYTLEGNLISIYPSLMQAYRETGADYRHISDCCLGKIKTSGGYIWRYLE